MTVWVEPAAGEYGEWTDWIVRCDRHPNMTWNRWTQERFAVQAAHDHQRRCEGSR